MSEYNILLPSKPKIIKDEGFKGLYQIDGLYPGYGHTLGNSLRRIILSSLPGFAVTSIEVDGISHEFSTIEGIKEDVIKIILNIKKLRIKLLTDEPQVLILKAKGIKELKAGDIEKNGQVEILNPEQEIATLTTAKSSLDMKITVKKGLGYVNKESMSEERTGIGMIIVDASFTPIRRVSYEVENMRVGDRTDFNRLQIFIETDGTISPQEALEDSIEIMIKQLSAIIGFEEESVEISEAEMEDIENAKKKNDAKDKKIDSDFLKTRIDSLNLSLRTNNALSSTSIRTIGGLVKKSEEDLLNIEGLGSKGIQEIKRILSDFGVILKK
ncbi:MAG: DNA-directed RNA polymerase subunit alpha [Candidatus Pacebacteria bacterium]|nr:DNA-directed RNA polymerase subunit alpha [Candidatus Paceibacterota bacterium]